MRHTAVLARVQRIRPNADGSGKMTYRGPCHLFDGDDFHNNAGRIKAWCGASCATVDLSGIEDRGGQKSALYSDLCGRCFIEPRRKASRKEVKACPGGHDENGCCEFSGGEPCRQRRAKRRKRVLSDEICDKCLQEAPCECVA